MSIRTEIQAAAQNQNTSLKQNTAEDEVKAMKRLPEKVGILFKWRFGRYDLGAWKKFFASLFHALFWETALEHMNELSLHDAARREVELIERQQHMHGRHLSDNKSFCFVYHVECPHCKGAIEVRNQAQIPECPHCKRKINLQPQRLNTLSSRQFVLFLQSQKFQWEPDGFHWYQDEQKQQIVITCAMAKYESHVEADFPSEELEQLIETLIDLPSYVHFHGNMVPDEETGEMTNGWSANLLPRPPSQDGYEWKLKPIVGDVLDFLQLPPWFNKQDFVPKLCNKCKTLNHSWSKSCRKCGNNFPQSVKRFRHNDFPEDFPEAQGQLLYRCGNCKAPVSDRNLETGKREKKCWNCHQPLGRWNADKRFDADFGQWKNCGFCGYQFNGSPSHCPCCSMPILEEEPVTCSGCKKVYNRKLYSNCPSCNTPVNQAEEFTALHARECPKCGEWHDKCHIELDKNKNFVSCPTTRRGIPKRSNSPIAHEDEAEMIDISDLHLLFAPTPSEAQIAEEEVVAKEVQLSDEELIEAWLREHPERQHRCPTGCGEKLSLQDQNCSGCGTEIQLCECGTALIGPDTNQCPGCGKVFVHVLNGLKEIPTDFFHESYDEVGVLTSSFHDPAENDLITAPVWIPEEEYSEESGLTLCEWRALEEFRQEERDLNQLHSSEWQLLEEVHVSHFSEKNLSDMPISDFSLGNSQNLWEEAFLEAVDTVAVMLEQHFVETIVENEEVEAWRVYTPSDPEVLEISRSCAAKYPS